MHGSGMSLRLHVPTVSLALLMGLGLPTPAWPQSNSDNPEYTAQPQTMDAQDEPQEPVTQTLADQEVPLEQLELLVKPLTKEQLLVEADGWQAALQDKVSEITQVRIAVQQQRADPQNAPSADASVLPALNEERAQLVDRVNTVLDELAAKGGDAEPYREYVAAVTGVALDVSDVSTFWTLFKGWLGSEQGGQRWLWNFIRFFVILAGFYFAAGIVSALVRHGASRVKSTSQLMRDFLGKFIKQALLLVGFIVALSALEIDVSPLLAAIGAAGFVIGFALQDTLGNFASGLLILAYKPFDVGHVIEAAGVSGVVDSVSLFSTKVRTFDNKIMIVPNNDIWSGTITNATASQTRRVDMVFGIGYDDDIDQASHLLESIVAQHEHVLQDPAPVIRLNKLGDSSVDFVVRPWCKTENYWAVYWDITQQVKQQFDQHGISIPFPQRDVHIYQQPLAGEGQETSSSDNE